MKKKVKKKSSRKKSIPKEIIEPIKKEKQTQRDLILILIYLGILILFFFFVSPFLRLKFNLNFENSILVSFLCVSILFFFYYYITRKRKWKKIEEPPKWIVKKRKKLGDDFNGTIVFKGKTYKYLISKESGETHYFVKQKNKD